MRRHGIWMTLDPRHSDLFFFNDTATTEIYTLSLHDALPISSGWRDARAHRQGGCAGAGGDQVEPDRKSTRLNSSHSQISYAVFCLKKKKTGETACECTKMVLAIESFSSSTRVTQSRTNCIGH